MFDLSFWRGCAAPHNLSFAMPVLGLLVAAVAVAKNDGTMSIPIAA
jgi:hypothetical protein